VSVSTLGNLHGQGSLLKQSCANTTSDHFSATVTYVLWREEHFCNAGVHPEVRVYIIMIIIIIIIIIIIFVVVVAPAIILPPLYAYHVHVLETFSTTQQTYN
jgi:hypothetical protein